MIYASFCACMCSCVFAHGAVLVRVVSPMVDTSKNKVGFQYTFTRSSAKARNLAALSSPVLIVPWRVFFHSSLLCPTGWRWRVRPQSTMYPLSRLVKGVVEEKESRVSEWYESQCHDLPTAVVLKLCRR